MLPQLLHSIGFANTISRLKPESSPCAGDASPNAIILAWNAPAVDNAIIGPKCALIALQGLDAIAGLLEGNLTNDNAVTAFAEGVDQTVLATGCQEGIVVEADSMTSAEVSFEDVALSLPGQMLLHAELNTEVPAVTLTRALVEGASERVRLNEAGLPMGTTAEASLLLDALERTLRSDEYMLTEVADTLTLLRQPLAPMAPTDVLVQDLLTSAGQGPLQAIDWLGQQVSARLESAALEVQLSFEAGNGEVPLTWSPVSLRTAPLGEDANAARVELPEMPAVQSAATFDKDQDRLLVEQLQFVTPLGSLGSQALHATTVNDVDRLREEIGCGVLEAGIAAQAELGGCAQECVAAVCDRAIGWVVSAAETRLLSLDGTRPTMTLNAELDLSDTNGDLLAEALSTDFLWGNWDPEEGQEGQEGDFISGTATAAVPGPIE